jgi:transposase
MVNFCSFLYFLIFLDKAFIAVSLRLRLILPAMTQEKEKKYFYIGFISPILQQQLLLILVMEQPAKKELTTIQPTLKKIKKKTFIYFIGIDVSKNELDYAVLYKGDLVFHLEGKNQPQEIFAFMTELKGLPRFTIANTVFCMENTGFYCNHLLNTLRSLKANIVVENAFRLKHSLGLIRYKDDKADSIRIAQYAQKNIGELKMWKSRREVILQLMYLLAVRSRLVGVSVVLKTPLKAQSGFFQPVDHDLAIRFSEQSLHALQSDIKAVNQEARQLVNADTQLKRLLSLVTSVPGIGELTAMQLLVVTNEFIDFNNPKKFACYSGIAPFRIQSGIVTGKARVSHMANKKIKKLLHTCAVVAVTHDQELRKYYKRKTEEERKPKMLVLNAVRNKLVLRVFACVNQNRAYKKDYVYDKAGKADKCP